ncbi:membrane protein insertion efficiency factor YidD [Candidatus Desantisbacteria bacterium]|nr:membrane protein insertion efficiency factor YidD [Candidatus Desantisbacteria bacterium]
MKYVSIKLIRLYQKYFSRFLPSSCRFYPSCSQYMIDAIEKYNFFIGLWLGIIRILKCHPFHSGGYDPVK